MRPHSIDDNFARITCPRCKQEHAYGGAQLAPLPIQAGDLRAVLCLRDQAEAQRTRAGYPQRFGGFQAFPFYIAF